MAVGGVLASSAAARTAPPARDGLGELLPQRVLGRTGESVTMLGVGGANVGMVDEAEAEAMIEAAIEGGVRFFDVAESYYGGTSERRYGKFLVPKYRDHVFLMTKSLAKDPATAREQLEGSLERMGTDHLDLWQVHALEDPADADGRIDARVLDVFLEAKESGKTRYIGFTGHSRPSAHQRMLELSDIFDTCQMPVNLADPVYESFIDGVLPTLVERNIGVLAMKSLAAAGFFGGTEFFQHGDAPRLVPDRVSLQQALGFVWSFPVSVIISGTNNVAQLKENIEAARTFAPLDAEERSDLIDKIADLAGPKVEHYKA